MKSTQSKCFVDDNNEVHKNDDRAKPKTASLYTNFHIHQCTNVLRALYNKFESFCPASYVCIQHITAWNQRTGVVDQISPQYKEVATNP